MADGRLDSAVLVVDGRALEPGLYARLQRLVVRESVQLPDDFELRFDDPHFELFDDATFHVGSRVDISLRAADEPVLVTAGEITAIAVEPGVSGRHELVVQGLDLTHRLARGPRTRTFQSMSAADIASRIASEHGLEADLEGGTEVLAYVVQAGETDLALLGRLAARGGLSVWVREDTLHLAPRTSGEGSRPTLTWGANLHRFSVRFSSAERTDDVEVHGWDPVAKRRVSGVASEPDRGSDAPAAAEMADDARRAFGSVVRRAHRIPVADPEHAGSVATALLARASGSEVLVRGETVGNPDLGPGGEVALAGVGRRLAGRYRVTSVEHLYGAGAPYVTRFVCGGVEPAALADLLGSPGTATGAGASALKRVEGGLMVGVVTNNEDPEALGRVRVQMSAFGDQDETAWARVAAPGAGAERGLQLLPEVDDEVVLGFEEGDLARPVVLGGLWNRADAPPEPGAVRDGAVTTRVLVGREGHRLAMAEEAGGPVDLALADGSCEVRLEKQESRLTGDQVLRVSAARVEVRATDRLSLAAPAVEISGDSTLTLSGGVIRLN